MCDDRLLRGKLLRPVMWRVIPRPRSEWYDGKKVESRVRREVVRLDVPHIDALLDGCTCTRTSELLTLYLLSRAQDAGASIFADRQEAMNQGTPHTRCEGLLLMDAGA